MRALAAQMAKERRIAAERATALAEEEAKRQEGNPDALASITSRSC